MTSRTTSSEAVATTTTSYDVRLLEARTPGMLAHMYSGALAVTAVAYSLLHHLGLLPSGIAPATAGTTWADWLDLAVPWVVLAPAAVIMWAADVSARRWVVFGAGLIAYTSGHGIHLAANSIGNQQPGEAAHLWDEVVGHYIWFAGVALVLWAVASTMVGRPRPSAVAYPLALAAGATWASNAVGGGTVLFSLLVALAACAFGWTQRRQLGLVLLVGYLPAALFLAIHVLLGPQT